MKPFIPSDINDLGLKQAAEFYRGLGLAVHPLQSSLTGPKKGRGKKPLLSGWKMHRPEDVTRDFLEKHFGKGSNNNIGHVVRGNFIQVDLDSKPDEGASVRAWLSEQLPLGSIPRERTGGGAHLVMICPDLPASVMSLKKPLVSQINSSVTAELFTDGMNVVLSPSRHVSGGGYHWEVTGEIPVIPWESVSSWFGFEDPGTGKKKTGNPRPKWTDLRALDLLGLVQQIGLAGQCLDPDEGKWSLRCPWTAEHSVQDEAIGSDTVIYSKRGKVPGFKCLHSHCADRKVADLVKWIDENHAGATADHYSARRALESIPRAPDGRIQIPLPGPDWMVSDFAAAIGESLREKSPDLYKLNGEVVFVNSTENDGPLAGSNPFSIVQPAGLVTLIERHVVPGVVSGKSFEFTPNSMTEKHARLLLSSQEFLVKLPVILRRLDVAVPMLSDDGQLIIPSCGYDKRFQTWLDPRAPSYRAMDFEEALHWLLNEVFTPARQGGFWWQDERDRYLALARLITPLCQGLMGWKRGPLWIFDGNRPGCGKDTCADITHITYTGRSVVFAPLSQDSDDEMRKRITAGLRIGQRFIHVANLKGHIRFPSLEAATDDSGIWEDRILGSSSSIVLPNETHFSFSANCATWEPDIERRARRIRLLATPEDINGHRYKHPDIKAWVREHRRQILSALWTLILRWIQKDCPGGPTPFASFPEWGRIVGGIFHACGLPDPCLPHADSQVSGDQNTRAMREFFSLAFSIHGAREIPKQEFQSFIQKNPDVHELFDHIVFTDRGGLSRFGKLIKTFNERELGGITLHIREQSKNRDAYRFTKADEDPSAPPDSRGRGDDGDVSPADLRGDGIKNSYEMMTGELPPSGPYLENVPHLPTSPPHVLHTSAKDLNEIAAELEGADFIALDIETYGHKPKDALDPWKGEIRLLSLYCPGGAVHLLDLKSIGYELGLLKQVIENACILAHNAKFDLLWLRVKCGVKVRRGICTLTAARLLTAGAATACGLDECYRRYLGIEPAADQSRSDWNSSFFTDEQLSYAADDVAHLPSLWRLLKNEIDAAGLNDVWKLESELLPCVIAMEEAGMYVSLEKLRTVKQLADEESKKAASGFREIVGCPHLNLDSTKQLLEALRGIGIPLSSTSEEVLTENDDGQAVPALLAYRHSAGKAKQVTTLISSVGADGRIHARFEPLGTKTGRFSSKGPNLQNVSRGAIRKAFTAAPGKALVVADYSQLELRAAAVIANETRMIHAYKNGVDLHRLTASSVLSKNESAVTKGDRQLAKAVNFGLLYGQSATGLIRYAAQAYGVGLEEAQAHSIHSGFFQAYPALQRWHKRCWREARNKSVETRTRLGRRRLAAESDTDWNRFTALVNTPVQGGTADGMKRAIILLSSRLPTGAAIVATVHDEIVVECPEASGEAVLEIVKRSMIEAMSEIFPEIPIEVEAGICGSWADK